MYVTVCLCQGSQWVLLTEAEVKERFVVIEERKKRVIESKLRAQLREEKRQKSEELLSKLAEARMHRKLEQQGPYDSVVYHSATVFTTAHAMCFSNMEYM